MEPDMVELKGEYFYRNTVQHSCGHSFEYIRPTKIGRLNRYELSNSPCPSCKASGIGSREYKDLIAGIVFLILAVSGGVFLYWMFS